MPNDPVLALSANVSVAAVRGENSKDGDGVVGKGRRGVVGDSVAFQGVYGHSGKNAGVVGESDEFDGVWGVSKANNKAGVFGLSKMPGGRGVVGDSTEFQGVYGHSAKNAGVVGESDTFDGVWGSSRNPTAAGVSGHNVAGGLAGYFDGDVIVTGDIRLVNADCAEDFDIAGLTAAAPGTVMVLDADGGGLRPSTHAYDRRVAGVVSGAGDFKPGIVLDKQDVRAGRANRQPIALMGKVFCQVDGQFGAIAAGDLLTTSPTPGHAMKAGDAQQAFGAVIGKALRPFAGGRGLLPILIALQ